MRTVRIQNQLGIAGVARGWPYKIDPAQAETTSIKAISIGSQSELDRAWVIPVDKMPQPQQSARPSPAGTPTWFRGGLFPAEAQLVSVERPLVGLDPKAWDRGFYVLPPYSAITESKFFSCPHDYPPRGFLFGGPFNEIDDLGSPLLDLDLHYRHPEWLPTKRAPRTYHNAVIDFGSEGAPASVGATIPMFGRSRASLSLRMSGYAAGTLRWSVVGRNEFTDGDAGTEEQFPIDHTLQAVTDETADFARTYYFDGEFDWLVISIAEQVALTGGACALTAILKLWD